MYLHSVKLINYKSIGTELNELIIEPNITAIIGKNESGKSNVIEGLSHINVFGNMPNAFNAENINRNNGTTATIEYVITLKPTSEEKSAGITEDTIVTISKDKLISTGGIIDYFNKYIKSSADSLFATLGQNPFQLRDQEYNNYSTYLSSLQPTESLRMRRIHSSIGFFETRIPKANAESREAIQTALNEFKEKWSGLESLIPMFFYRNSNKILKSSYKFDEVKKELENPMASTNSLLPDLVSVIGINPTDFINAVQAGGSGSKITIRDRIKRAINCKINEEFKKFYLAEEVTLDAYFDSNIVTFSVRTNEGEALSFAERSNGLKWYLNTFIDALAHGISRSNVIYLFDEPGTSLHVNAQKELLSLFQHLSDKGNQIIYSTHLPHMLDIEGNGIHRIRAVVKSKDGFTHIYKNAYDGRISHDTQQDTYAPIINAIGMSLNDTFGPSVNKINVVCEGTSDYIYLHTIFNIMGDTNINLIPSFGVTNSVSICNILKGWGCPFVSLFDYDKEGVEKGGNKLDSCPYYEYKRSYLYIVDVDETDITSKSYSKTPVVIEDLIGREQLQEFIKKSSLPEDADKNNKVLLAKLFCNSIEAKEMTLTKESLNNFSLLLQRIYNTQNID